MGPARGQIAARAPRHGATLEAGDEVTDDETGDVYRMVSLIGEGGMGRVFRAIKVGDGGVFAVKCNQAIDPGNPGLMARTRNEGAFLKGLRKHPHIVPVLATGLRDDGVFWMVMPLLDGASVEGLLQVMKRIPLVWALEIGRAVCAALATVHEVAIHRDIKPANVFVTRTGGIYVLDFGAGKFYSVGRLTTTGTSLGTIPYMSPEQLSDPEHLDARTDLFSLGVMFFEMLAGVNPFDGDGALRGNAITIGYRILNDPPRPLAAFAPNLPGYVYEISEKLLAKDRAHRGRNAATAARIAGETFLAARAEMRSRLGEPPPIDRMFEAYDALLKDQQAPVAGEDTEPAVQNAEPAVQAAPLRETDVGGGTAPVREAPAGADAAPSPGLPKLGTVPMFVLPAGVAPASFRPSPADAVGPGAVPATAPASPLQAEITKSPAARGPASVAVAPVNEDAEAPRSARAGWPAGPAEGDRPALRSEDEVFLHRKLEAIDRLSEDDSPETREALLFALVEYDDHPVIRSAATIALRRVGDASCLEVLEDRALNDPQPLVRRMAEEAVLAISRRLGRPVEPLARATAEAEPPRRAGRAEVGDAPRSEGAGGVQAARMAGGASRPESLERGAGPGARPERAGPMSVARHEGPGRAGEGEERVIAQVGVAGGAGVPGGPAGAGAGLLGKRVWRARELAFVVVVALLWGALVVAIAAYLLGW